MYDIKASGGLSRPPNTCLALDSSQKTLAVLLFFWSRKMSYNMVCNTV